VPPARQEPMQEADHPPSHKSFVFCCEAFVSDQVIELLTGPDQQDAKDDLT